VPATLLGALKFNYLATKIVRRIGDLAQCRL